MNSTGRTRIGARRRASGRSAHPPRKDAAMNRRLPIAALVLLLVASASVTHDARGAVPAAGTLSPAATSVKWTGGPFTAVTADPAACTALTCDNFTLAVSIPSTYYATYP